MSSSGQHTHAPDGRDVLKKRAMEEFRKMSLKPIPRRAVVQAFCSDVLSQSEALSAVLPQANSLLSSANRFRVRHNIICPNPQTLAELKIPDAYKMTSTGQIFLLFDSGMLHFNSNFTSILISGAL